MPTGICACGCGGITAKAKRNIHWRSIKKDQHFRFIHGHRLKTADYRVDESNGCWVWLKSLINGGYGHTSVGKKSAYAHRVYYERANGPIPDGLELDHLCRNRACVNPAHLEAVPPKVNCHRGYGTKLSLEKASLMREMRGRPQKEIAEKFGVSISIVSDVLAGKRWAATIP